MQRLQCCISVARSLQKKRNIARAQMQQAQGEFSRIQAQAPGTIARARALMPPRVVK